VPRLCVRITPKRVKSFAFAYRNKATRKVEWLTIGRYPDVPLTRARDVAMQHVAKGQLLP
jgi:hypothetical protein